ncbi:hypothetical protein B0H14DRAFT_3498604 [Mycena olivaceomarginata]|nr:hypothetical protein B0H14DRAFT_3498604 [Mycena olivaceomarginata]
MPLFTNHHAMLINAHHALCPEPLCNQFLPASRQCQYGTNQGKYYVAQNIAQSPAPPPSMQAATRRPPPHLSTQCLSCTRPGNAQVHETRPPALSTSTRRILETGLAEAAAAFPAPRQPEHELPHQRLARQQEAAVRLAALTPLPPSPTLSQEERDEALAVRLALGTSPPPPITTPHTRRVSLVSWVHNGEARTTVVQDVNGLALTWPTIHLNDFAPFLLSPIYSRLDAYYDFFDFRISQWVAIPQAYAFDVVTDEPILLRRVGSVADDEDNVIASFARFVNRNLYFVQLPTTVSCKRQRVMTPTSRVTTPTIRQLDKRRKIKNGPADSSSDKLEVSEVTRMVKLEPVMPHIPRPSCTCWPAIHSRHPVHLALAVQPLELRSLHVHLAPSAQLLAASHCFQLTSLHVVVVRGALRVIVLSLPFCTFLIFGHSSASSSSSLASAGSSFGNPIDFLDEKDKND